MSITSWHHGARWFEIRFCLTVTLSALAAGSAFAADKPADTRPNILFALADDWSWPHAGVYGDRVVQTPTLDRVATEGMLFSHVFSVTPSCTASRAAILTGQASHRLEESANLCSILQQKFEVYPDLLEAEGYHVGYSGKGWGPGTLYESGRTRNPAGPEFKDFEEFFQKCPPGKPFCFWFGSRDPHRPYIKGSGIKAGIKPENVQVPPFLPDTHEVRGDICDYYFAVQRYDSDVGAILKRLEGAGQLDNTIVLMTGDNGWPFPRAKANLYDAGTRQPLAVRWAAKVKAGGKSDAFISFQDFAPTFLEAAGLKPRPAMTGRSFLDLLAGQSTVARDRVFLERERHANVRQGNLSYPSRAIRTREFLYIRNFHPERWPNGDPQTWMSTGPFGDIDNSPSKDGLLANRDTPLFQLAVGKRPAEELYAVRKDQHQLTDLAERAELADTKRRLRADLERWMRDTDDPRAKGDDARWDRYTYYSPENNGGWFKSKVNPVLGGALGTCFDVALLKEGDTFRMWFSWRPKASIALVESKDGIHWSAPVIALGPDRHTDWEADVNRPVVLKRPDGYHMWYTGQAKEHSWIGHATSQDGKTWTRDGHKPVLSPEQPWEKVAVMCPHVLWDEQQRQYRMWYSGGEQHEPNAIGHATSPDGRNWTKAENNPVFRPDPTRPWEKHKVTACQVVRQGDWYIMFYIGFRDENYAQINLARSRDGLSAWERHPENPILRPGAGTWDRDAVYKPFAILDGQRWLLWYNGRHGGTEQIGMAVHEGVDLGF